MDPNTIGITVGSVLKHMRKALKSVTGYDEWIWGATARFLILFAVMAVVFLIPAGLIILYDVMR